MDGALFPSKGRFICIPYGSKGDGWTRWSCELLRGCLDARLPIRPLCVFCQPPTWVKPPVIMDDRHPQPKILRDTIPTADKITAFPIDMNPHAYKYNEMKNSATRQVIEPAPSTASELDTTHELEDKGDPGDFVPIIDIIDTSAALVHAPLNSGLTWEEMSGVCPG